MSYEYIPLNVHQNEIRLVRVLPGCGDDELHCTITHERLNPNLDYQALSYAWIDHQVYSKNDINIPEKLFINEDSFCLIQKNLASFFKHIRLADNTTGLIWVDALCINQNDTTERSSQVLRMSEVYKLAQRVFVWLGPENNDSTAALSFIKHPLDVEIRPAHALSTDFAWWSAAELATLESGIRTQATVPTWKAVIHLLERAWWSRTWVVQESFLGQELIFMCGHEIATWLVLWNLVENLWAHSHLTRPSTSALSLRHTQASDPRDKVYGLLGLASDAKLIVPCPDYSLTYEEVYTDLFKTMTSVRGDLDWLTLADSTRNDSIFPSWYPDLTKKSPVDSINTSRSVAEGKLCGFYAAKDSKPVLELDSASLKCTITGFMVDRVDGVGAKQEMHTVDPIAIELTQPLSEARGYGTDEEIYEAIWKTLVADQDFNFEGARDAWRAPPTFGLMYAKNALVAEEQLKANNELEEGTPELSYLRNWFARNRELRFARKTIGEWTLAIGQSHAYDNPDNTNGFRFERRIQSTMSGRRLITSEKGYLGIANESVCQGDYICIFLGGRMPVVLRPIGDTYRFIGECYIHGIMFGQAWDTLEFGVGSRKQFVLS
ncbi:hypothetical protein MMC22_002000 [Lobaria immixta]|nr:hypothetical protein [Lobaria immixta]